MIMPQQNKIEVTPPPPLPIATRAGSVANERECERECESRKEHEHSSQQAQAKSKTEREAKSRCEEMEVQPNWAAPMSNPAQPRPVPHQASPTQVGQREHPEDARWQAQVQKLTQIGTHRTAQAGSTKSSLLQWSQYLERTPTKFPSSDVPNRGVV